jgi:hypothetical protein
MLLKEPYRVTIPTRGDESWSVLTSFSRPSRPYEQFYLLNCDGGSGRRDRHVSTIERDTVRNSVAAVNSTHPIPAAQTAPPAMSVMPAMKRIVSVRVSIELPRMMRPNC